MVQISVHKHSMANNIQIKSNLQLQVQKFLNIAFVHKNLYFTTITVICVSLWKLVSDKH